ncbi:PucR family transcriptional regulator [Streptomyces minutiscleroticus]|uniref:PucR family transcriptional regulator n=2 Tax=Streptomyces minutiscleroticus TaxID=68238 RepID=UPI00167D14F5
MHTVVGCIHMSTTSPDSCRVTAFADWIDSSLEEVADKVFRACVEAVPSFVINGPEVERAFRRACSSFLSFVSRAVSTGEITHGAVLPPEAEHLTRRLPAAGIKLVDLVLTYDVAGNELLDAFGKELRAGSWRPEGCDRADMLSVVMGRLFRFRQAALSQAMAVYRQEQELLRRCEIPDIRETVRQALTGELGEAEAERRLGYRMDTRHVGFVVWGSGAPEAALRQVAARLCSQLRAGADLTVPSDGHALHGWLSLPDNAPGVDVLRARLSVPEGIRISLGMPHHGGNGFRITHREALETQSLADRAMPQPTRPGAPAEACSIVSFRDVVALVFASRDVELASHFVRCQLGSLVEPRHSVLRETLRVWFEELGSPTRAARRLNVHVNTLVKRLNRAAEIVDRPLHAGDFAFRFAFELSRIHHGNGVSEPHERGR